MATMNRNINLEEINTDAFMGIPYLNHQSILQKITLIGCCVIGVGANLLCNFYFHLNANFSIIIALIPLIIGVAFGCNYNKDLSLIKYVTLVLFKPYKAYYSKPEEDLEQLRNSSERIRQEEESLKKQTQNSSKEEQRKLLLKVIIGFAIGVFLLIVFIFIMNGKKEPEIHHTVAVVYSCQGEML